MSMILLEPARTILYGSVEDKAADHLINGVCSNFDPQDTRSVSNLPKCRLSGSIEANAKQKKRWISPMAGFDETGMLFGCFCAVPVCYGRSDRTDTRPIAPRCPPTGSSASTESFSEV